MTKSGDANETQHKTIPKTKKKPPPPPKKKSVYSSEIWYDSCFNGGTMWRWRNGDETVIDDEIFVLDTYVQ